MASLYLNKRKNLYIAKNNYMVITTENILLIGSVLLFLSILAGKAGYRFGIPVLLLFLGVGMLFGSDGFGIEFNSPYVSQFIGLVALSVILFSGGLDTKMEDIKPVMVPGLILSSMGVLITVLVTASLFYVFTNSFTFLRSFSFAESMLIGSIISSTDSASVFAILRSKSLKLKGNLKPLLELESGSNDPMAFMLTIVSISMIKYADMTFWRFAIMVIMQMSIGVLSGLLFSKLALYFISKVEFVNRSFYHIILLSLLFFIFSFTDLIRGNGFLAVYVAGLTIGNSKVQCDQSAYTFFDGIAWLSQLVLFLTLGLLVNPFDLIKIDILTKGIILSGILIFISRPFAVFTSLAPFRSIPNKFKHYISWVGLRGAVPIVFATYPLIEGLPKADIIFNLVFFVTIVSLIVQGSSISYVAKKMGLLDVD